MSDDTSSPRGLSARALADWAALAEPTPTPSPFEPGAVTGLPAPVRRWLTHVIEAGTPLRSAVELRMHGEIRLGAWRPFTAVQRLTPAGGFVWAATARLLGLPVTGFDRFTGDTGEMRWRLLNALPVMGATGDDITRSAAGRHAGELLLAAPGAAFEPGVSWKAVDGERAVATIREGRRAHEVTLTIDERGALTELHMTRRGNPGKEPFGEYPFGAVLEDEVSFDGFTIPRRVTAGWHHRTECWAEGEFIRYTVDQARYR